MHPVVRSLLALSLYLLVTPVAHAAVTPAHKCSANKLDATARALVAHAACEARALQKNTTVRAGCHESADRRLGTAFARIEARGGCLFTGDEEAVDGAIDAIVGGLVAGQTPGKCGATKLRMAAQKASVELGCHRVGARRGEPPKAACLSKALTRFLAAFERADARLACGTPGDAATVQSVLDAFVAETAARLIEGDAALQPNPTNLAASIQGDAVELTWTAPGPASGNTHVRVLRRLDIDPVDASDADATVVFFGTTSAASHALKDLLPTTPTVARTYHYAAFGCTAGGDCESAASRTTLAPTVRQVLLAGGYTIYFRHASATVCVDQTGLGTAATTMVPDWWKSCDANCGTTATARQLDATGTTQATTIGQAFDTVGIPVGRVIASEFCRTRTTAELMDLGPAIETDQGITFFVYDEANRCASANALLAEVPATGNTAIVGHGGFSCDVLGLIGMGEAAIFKPVSGGPSVFITRVLPDAWATLP